MSSREIQGVPASVHRLSVVDHRRDSAGLKYVYPVISRRAGGVSIGINLNCNNACNWACVYCQVPDLRRGGPDPVDLTLLEREFRAFLGDLLYGDFMQREVPPEARRLADVAFSGNGEPTSAPELAAALEIVSGVMSELGVKGVPVRLITNGSLIRRDANRRALECLAQTGGEVWFKIDRATAKGIAAVNQISLDPAAIGARLEYCCERVPTWVQTCWFGIDGAAPAPDEEKAYLDFIATHAARIRGVLLYGIARQPMQPGSERLTRLAPEELQAFGRRIEACGVRVSASP